MLLVQEIHAKITSIGFQDCKVFIHSVDAQSSANGGIIIQVIGEMSNKGEPWRKFVQTFFLAEQPNGYFVLNDIFRFLKEETVEDEPTDEAEPVADAPAVQEPPPAPATPAPAPPPHVAEPEPEPEPIPELAREPTPPPAPVPEEPVVPAVSEPAAEQQPNGEFAEEAESTTQLVELSIRETPAATPSPAPTASPAPPVTESAPSPAPQPVAAPAPAQPTPTAPVRKTWANLAAAGSNKWGAAVAQEAKGVSEAPASITPVPSTPHSPAPRNQNQPHPLYVQASTASTPQCFVKVSRLSLTMLGPSHSRQSYRVL